MKVVLKRIVFSLIRLLGETVHVKAEKVYFHCSDQLKRTLATEIEEVESAVATVKWADVFQYSDKGTVYKHQAGYNKAFSTEFSRLSWESQPFLREGPKLIGDFRKGLVFVEVQFGNSSTLYRDYYKFQYGLATELTPVESFLAVSLSATDKRIKAFRLKNILEISRILY